MAPSDLLKLEEARRVETTEAVPPAEHAEHATGTVQLLDSKHIVLIPTPSRDPRDPLNLPEWRKNVLVLIVGLYSAFAVLATSGLGPVAPLVTARYPDDDPARVTDLLTYPALFMGVGNLVAMPLSVAVGRRPVFLLSLAVLVLAAVWCACARSLAAHVAGRDVLSLAAGQSEALVALMVQDVSFVHQRATRGTWNAAIQGVVCGALFVATTYLVPAWGLRWWYAIIALASLVLLVLAFFLVPETEYDRVVEDYDGEGHAEADGNGAKVQRVTTTATHRLDYERYGRPSWREGLAVVQVQPRWGRMVTFYKNTVLALTVPTIIWLLLLNGAFLGVYVFQSSTFAGILLAPPYGLASEFLGFVQLALVLATALALPLIGYGSDLLIRLASRANRGVYEPEFRLLALAVPAGATVASCVVYGQAGARPPGRGWAAVAVPYALGYFAFLGANTVGITYVVDSWPREAGPLLLIVAAGRGFISFGLSYTTVPWVARDGYDRSSNVYAIVCGVLSGLGFFVFFLGKRIRLWTQRRYWPLE